MRENKNQSNLLKDDSGDNDGLLGRHLHKQYPAQFRHTLLHNRDLLQYIPVHHGFRLLFSFEYNSRRG